ncbi:MAG: tryptophan synthase subunit alpha [Deltaproteobacteria bacterium]
MNRIDDKFKTLNEKGKKALITFVTAGDPSLEATIELIEAMENAGADIIELGVPFSDPLAEGPVIQAASERALKNGMKIEDVFAVVSRAREKTEIPLILLIYFNCIFKYGLDDFFKKCEETGVDGVIVPDLPFEEKEEINSTAQEFGINVITLIAPTSKERMKRIAKDAKGFVYCVSSLGVTGVREEFHKNLAEFVKEIHSYTDIPRAVGFGISTPEQVRSIKEFSEGVIVGSAIVKKIEEVDAINKAIEGVRRLVEELRKALDE